MSVKRHSNSMKNSNIRAVLTCTGINACGTLGSRFTIQQQDYSMDEHPCDKIADFLNSATGKANSKRIISEEVELALFNDFSDQLKIQDGKYLYTGSEYYDHLNYYDDNYAEFSQTGYKKTLELVN